MYDTTKGDDAMILIEGPDGAGKTTLAHELSKRYGFSIAGTRGPSEDVRERVYSALGHAVAGDKPVVIYDRLFFSELVYGSVLRGKVMFSNREEEYIKRVLAALKCPIIFCIPNIKVIDSNLEQKEHLEGVRENIGEIHRRYMNLFTETTGMNRTLWDYKMGLNKHWDAIDHYLILRRERTWTS
jgi:thymidylate kinase